MIWSRLTFWQSSGIMLVSMIINIFLVVVLVLPDTDSKVKETPGQRLSANTIAGFVQPNCVTGQGREACVSLENAEIQGLRVTTPRCMLLKDRHVQMQVQAKNNSENPLQIGFSLVYTTKDGSLLYRNTSETVTLKPQQSAVFSNNGRPQPGVLTPKINDIGQIQNCVFQVRSLQQR